MKSVTVTFTFVLALVLAFSSAQATPNSVRHPQSQNQKAVVVSDVEGNDRIEDVKNFGNELESVTEHTETDVTENIQKQEQEGVTTNSIKTYHCYNKYVCTKKKYCPSFKCHCSYKHYKCKHGHYHKLCKKLYCRTCTKCYYKPYCYNKKYCY